MTDRDVVERVASCFGSKVLAIDRGSHRTEYAATLKGARGVAFMSDIRCLMGERRQGAINAAVRSHRPPMRKLDFAAAEEIRHRFAKGEGVSSLARHYEGSPLPGYADTRPLGANPCQGLVTDMAAFGAGSRAISLMLAVRPALGERRTRQIDAALSAAR
jgi:hypothetical protein